MNKWFALFSRTAKRLWWMVYSPIRWTSALITRVSSISKNALSNLRQRVRPLSPSSCAVQRYIDSLVTSTQSNLRLTTTNPARISSGFSRKVTLLGDTSSEDSLDQCVSNIRISETSTSTSQTQQEPTSWRGQEVGPHRPIFYPPPISLLEPTCRPSLIFPTKPRSPSAPRPPSPVSRRRMTLIRLSPLRTERLLGIRTSEPTEENA